MKDLFAEFMPLNSVEIQRIWDEALIIPDANVLLNLYRFTAPAREELFSLFEDPKVNARIWLPYWAALEFHRNRALVIAEQGVPYDRLTATIDKHVRNLVDEIQQVQLHRYHPYISKEDLTAATATLRDALLSDLKARASTYPNFLTEDVILERVQNLFAGKLGVEPTATEKEDIIRVGEERFKKKIPPGYLDEAKEGIDKYGDYIIWREVLQNAHAAKRPVIFVTDDAKEDWWYRVKGRTVGARPELRREFRSETGEEFLLYTSTEFARYAKDYLGRQARMDELIRQMELITWLDQYTRHRTEEKGRSVIDGSATDTEGAGDEPSVDEMVEWFYDNYEDPANGVPYESREGGYQYFNGGPHDPMDVLQSEFPDVAFERVEEAAQAIYRDGFEWVRKGDY